MSTTRYQSETYREYERVPSGTVSRESAALGMNEREPLIVAFDALLRYAKAYRRTYEAPLADDGVLGGPWLDAAKSLRALLNGDGAVAMERGITTDSKDNGMLESLFWKALDIAGFEEGDL